MSLLEVTNLKKIYTTRFGGNKVQALNNVNFSVEKGEFVAIMGESGSGKTTLLNILATLDKPTSGDVLLDGKSLGHLSDKEISTFRRKNLGLDVYKRQDQYHAGSHHAEPDLEFSAGRSKKAGNRVDRGIS